MTGVPLVGAAPLEAGDDRRTPRPLAARVLVGAIVAFGVLTRLWPRGPLWLDEAQSVAFARLPLAEIPGALREDGAPPLYYVVLHAWMRLVGDGDHAVRALSVVASLVAWALVVVMAYRRAGRGAATAVALVFAVHPFVVRYATEARMYALVMLEVVVGLLLLDRCLRRPRASWLVALALVTAALLYTHYWSLYLIAVTGLALAVNWHRRPPARRALASVVAGVVLWLPWLPTLRFQTAHTGTPWARPAGLHSLGIVTDVGRGPGWWPVVTALVFAALAAVGVWRGPPLVTRVLTARWLGAVVAATVVLAVVVGSLTGSAAALRYTSAVVPLTLMVVSSGAVALGRTGLVAALSITVALGLGLVLSEVRTDRTHSGSFVEPLRASAPGDVVVYCPDQLGPGATRLLEQAGIGGLRQLVFPPGRTPDRVDWIDYADRHASATPAAFAVALDRSAPMATIWVVWSGTYPPTQRACKGFVDRLRQRRPSGCEVVPDDPALVDHGALWRFEPAPARSAQERRCPPGSGGA